MVQVKKAKNYYPSESHEQIVFIARVRFFYPHLVFNVMSIPNGGWRHKKTASQLKKEGLLAGAPDILVALVRGKWPGLFIEMKRVKGGQVRKNQKKVHMHLKDQGYKVEVCKGADAAWKVFEDYVKMECPAGKYVGISALPHSISALKSLRLPGWGSGKHEGVKN